MVITGMFTAASAQVVDDKLNVTGGVIAYWDRRAGEPVFVTLVLLTQAHDEAADSITVIIHGPDGTTLSREVPVAEATKSGRDSGFMICRALIPAEAPDGRYVFESGGHAAPLTITTV